MRIRLASRRSGAALSRATLSSARTSAHGIDMTQLQFDTGRSEHPLDVVERLAAIRDWMFDRAETDEMCVSVSGRWADYEVAFTWIADVESVHLACAFDLKAPERRRDEVRHLISLI